MSGQGSWRWRRFQREGACQPVGCLVRLSLWVPKELVTNGHMSLVFLPTSNFSCLLELKFCYLKMYLLSQLKKKKERKKTLPPWSPSTSFFSVPFKITHSLYMVVPLGLENIYFCDLPLYLTLFCEHFSIYYIILTVMNSVSVQYFIFNIYKATIPILQFKNTWFGVKKSVPVHDPQLPNKWLHLPYLPSGNDDADNVLPACWEH